jgi:hypothetical protein
LAQQVVSGVGVGGTHPDHRGGGGHAETAPQKRLTSGAVIAVADAHQGPFI